MHAQHPMQAKDLTTSQLDGGILELAWITNCFDILIQAKHLTLMLAPLTES